MQSLEMPERQREDANSSDVGLENLSGSPELVRDGQESVPPTLASGRTGMDPESS